MNAEIKAQWTAALRGGEYVQGRGFLNADGKFCCLGVLCELAVKAGIIESNFRECDPTVIYYGDRNDTLSDAVVKWAGLPDGEDVINPHNPAVTVDRTDGITRSVSLAELNDGENSAERVHSFDEIADIIDAQL
jgi:hypothetical protein